MASRISALTSTSCGIGVSGSTKKISASIFPRRSARRSAGRRRAGRFSAASDRELGQASGSACRRAGGDDRSRPRNGRVRPGEGDHVVLLLVMRDEREPYFCGKGARVRRSLKRSVTHSQMLRGTRKARAAAILARKTASQISSTGAAWAAGTPVSGVGEERAGGGGSGIRSAVISGTAAARRRTATARTTLAPIGHGGLGYRRGRGEHGAAFLGQVRHLHQVAGLRRIGVLVRAPWLLGEPPGERLVAAVAGVVAACALQPVEPGWQPMRMWK